MNISCRRATELLSEQQDRDLTFMEWAALHAHLAICRGCRAVSRQFRTMRSALRALFREET